MLLSVEAMKMEHQLVAPLDGTVHISVSTGDLVKADQVLATIHAASTAGALQGRGHAQEAVIAMGAANPARPQQHHRPTHRHEYRHRSHPWPDFELSEEYQDLSDTVREFADEVVAPVSAKHDEEHSFPYEIVSQMADMGLFGLPFPEEFGGMGGDYFALALALEQLGRVDQSVAITLEAGVSLGAMPVYRFGTEAQKQEWLPLLASGKALAGFGLTEPEAGSDAGGTKTTAKLERRGMGHQRQQGIHHQLRHRHHPARHRHRRDRPGGTPGRQHQEGDLHHPGAHRHARVHGGEGLQQGRLERLGHPPADPRQRPRPGGEPAGRRGAAATPTSCSILDEGRIAIAALAIGAAQGCVDQSVKYAKERSAFGQNIGKYQAIAFKIARMQARAHTARLAYYDAAARMLAGKPFKTQAAIAKMVAGEAAMDNARDATQVFGGYGFINEFTVARHYRDSKILEVGEGTTEVQLMLIARELGL